MTAIDWLEMQYHKKGYALSSNDFQEAKQMEKEQIEYPELEGTMNLCNDIISDREIEIAAAKMLSRIESSHRLDAFKLGAKWMRDQLKNK